MQQVTLTPTRGEAVEFNGELLFRLDGADDGQTGGRWHDIEIYRTDSAMLAVSLVYRSSAPNESEHGVVHTAEDVADVDAMLSLYAPNDSVVMEPGLKRTRVVEAVTRQYDLQVNEVLSRLQTLSEVTASASKPR